MDGGGWRMEDEEFEVKALRFRGWVDGSRG